MNPPQIDIKSYHPSSNLPHLSPNPMKSKEISHFSPISFPPISSDIISSRSKLVSTSQARSASEQPHSQKQSRESKKSVQKKKPDKQTVQLPTIQRPRPKENDVHRSLVPHLHADQRVRGRSKSKEAPKTLPKEQKKVVAFGRTTAVENNNLDVEPRQSSKPSSDTIRLRAEFEELRHHFSSHEKLQKEVDSLKDMMKPLAKSAKRIEFLTKENEQFRKEIDVIKDDLVKEVEKNVELTKRLDNFELLLTKLSNSENSSSSGNSKKKQSDEPIQRSYVKCPAPLASAAVFRTGDELFSRISPSTNQVINQIGRKKAVQRANSTLANTQSINPIMSIQVDSVHNATRETPEQPPRRESRKELRRELRSGSRLESRQESCQEPRQESCQESRQGNSNGKVVIISEVNEVKQSPKRGKSKNGFKPARTGLMTNQRIDLPDTNEFTQFDFNRGV